jgi:hypothetical protein
MHDFRTTQEAKEYLIGQIVGEAGREKIGLSEIEQKMLYFSESGWTLPNIVKVNEEFERDYNNDEYEQKIAGLIRGIEDRQDGTRGEIDEWRNAIRKLSGEDHYLLTLIGLAGGSRSGSSFWERWLPSIGLPASNRVRGDFFRLLVAAIVLVAILLTLTALRDKLSR